jgi:hypothetical protein
MGPDQRNLVSLLWPHGKAENSTHTGTCQAGDLSLDRIVAALTPNGRHRDVIWSIFTELCDDPDVIRYRGDILSDLIAQPALIEGLETASPFLVDLTSYTQYKRAPDTPFHEAILRLGELDIYVSTVRALLAALNGKVIDSEGLKALRSELTAMEADPLFGALAKELPELNARIRGIASVTIGVNLDQRLVPIEAALLSVNTEKFKPESLVDRLLGKKGESPAVGPLHSVPVKIGNFGDGQSPERENPLLFPLFRDLNKILAEVVKPIAQTLTRYVRVNTRALIRLEPEIIFYLGAAKLIRDLREAGAPMCRPEIAPKDDRRCTLTGMYNLALALRMRDNREALRDRLVLNDVSFDESGRIFILTGPNQGGKTTYTQAIGIAQLMLQAGLYVPAESAIMSPVDGLFTHFPVEERPEMEAGRLGEESRRLNAIFASATPTSLILLNESLSSTSAGESLYLAQDIVRSLRLLGVRAIFATHLHELAERIAQLNQETSGDSQIASLVSVAEHDMGHSEGVRRTYKVIAAPPRGLSYAREIASRYGISYDQIAQMLRERGVIRGKNDGTL